MGICQKCLTGRSGDVIGGPCRTPGCDGTIEEPPTYASLVETLLDFLTCRRRMDSAGPWEQEENLDHWDRFKFNGDRVCSFCGSLHPDDFLKYVQESAKDDSSVQIEPSDKRYKIYVSRPSVRNAHEGGIKFYTWHLVAALTEVQQDAYRTALRNSRDRFDKKFKQLCGGPAIPADESHREIEPATGQQKDYVVLSATERAKGFVRPVRGTYVHVGKPPEGEKFEYPITKRFPGGCGTRTTMPQAIAETYARDPGFYSGTFCCSCMKHLPLDQFVWEGTTEQVGS